jgi:hypothetical protein
MDMICGNNARQMTPTMISKKESKTKMGNPLNKVRDFDLHPKKKEKTGDIIWRRLMRESVFWAGEVSGSEIVRST